MVQKSGIFSEIIDKNDEFKCIYLNEIKEKVEYYGKK
jgi:hypothetical protein